MVDFATQRTNMVESQVRPSDVTDRRIMQAMGKIRRELFLPQALRSVAYSDNDLIVPFYDGDTPTTTVPPTHLLMPRTLARMIAQLSIGDDDVVLNVACGTGYSTAVLAEIAQTVVAVTDATAWAGYATDRLSDAGVDNAVVLEKPLADGHPEEGPYDSILVNGMVEEIPAGLLDQLKDGGRLVAVVDTGRMGHAMEWRRIGAQFDHRWLFDTTAPRLAAFSRPPAFVF